MATTRLKKKSIKLSRTQLLFLSIAILLLLPILITGTVSLSKQYAEHKRFLKLSQSVTEGNLPDFIDVQLIDIDGAARRGTKLDCVKNIVIHYVGNPMSSAQANRDYFDNKGTEVSSHFVVGLKGEIIQCVPLDEKSSASNHRNNDTISIEICHPDETGKFNDTTYKSVIKLSAWLCEAFDLTADDLIRHHDVTGKNCPKYYVENEDAWEKLKEDVNEYIKENPDYYKEKK